MIGYEVKKIFRKPSGKVALVLFTLLAAVVCYSVTHGYDVCWYYGSEQELTGHSAAQKLRQAQGEWTGTLDRDMLERALAFLKESDFYERQGANQIRGLLNRSFQTRFQYQAGDYYIAETVQPEQLSSFYENRVTLLKQWLYEEEQGDNNGFFHYTQQEKEFLVQRMAALETPIQVGHILGWEQAAVAVGSFSAYGAGILGYLLSGMFSNEAGWKTDSVFYTTRYGRRKGTAAKLLAGFFITTALYWAFTLTAGGSVLLFLGAEGGRCPVQADNRHWFSIYQMTFSERFLGVLLSCYLGWLFVTAAVMLVGAKWSSAALGAVLPVLLIIGPAALWEILPEKLLQLLPTGLFTLFNDLACLHVYTVFGRVLTPIPVVLTLYAGLTALFAWLCYRSYRRKQLSG